MIRAHSRSRARWLLLPLTLIVFFINGDTPASMALPAIDSVTNQFNTSTYGTSITSGGDANAVVRSVNSFLTVNPALRSQLNTSMNTMMAELSALGFAVTSRADGVFEIMGGTSPMGRLIDSLKTMSGGRLMLASTRIVASGSNPGLLGTATGQNVTLSRSALPLLYSSTVDPVLAATLAHEFYHAAITVESNTLGANPFYGHVNPTEFNLQLTQNPFYANGMALDEIPAFLISARVNYDLNGSSANTINMLLSANELANTGALFASELSLASNSSLALAVVGNNDVAVHLAGTDSYLVVAKTSDFPSGFVFTNATLANAPAASQTRVRDSIEEALGVYLDAISETEGADYGGITGYREKLTPQQTKYEAKYRGGRRPAMTAKGHAAATRRRAERTNYAKAPLQAVQGAAMVATCPGAP